ncbi:MAG: TRAP transporter large permease [Flavobacteriaceae bacterium]|nr:TRAP transporter large permease [Flavobacteriaceae bacterium]MCY4253218.1 TRAP transporter large permease [Flavobacteriaceae bacterium]
MNIEILSAIVLFSSFAILLVNGVPVAYSIGISTSLVLIMNIDFIPSVTTTSQRMTTGVDNFTLLAIPFFILAGDIMNTGGVARRLINFAKSLIGSLPGGLAYVNVLSAMLFGSISGSAIATASAIGSTLTDKMENEGYPREFSAAINISSSTTGLLIPPSNVLIVFALASGGMASVAALFVAGYVPGILVGLSIMIVIYLYVKRNGFSEDKRVKFKNLFNDFRRAFLSLTLLFIVVGGIVAGIFTATEAAAIAVIYSAILGFCNKELSIKDFKLILLRSTKTTAVVMFLIATSMAMSWLFSFQGIPQILNSLLVDSVSNPILVFLFINIILLVVGTFIDMTPAVLIFTPIFLPVVTELGMHPVQFGIVLVLNLCIGVCTPPVGTLLFVGSGVAKVSVMKVMRPLIIFLAAMTVILILITFLPEISLWLPRFFGLID